MRLTGIIAEPLFGHHLRPSTGQEIGHKRDTDREVRARPYRKSYFSGQHVSLFSLQQRFYCTFPRFIGLTRADQLPFLKSCSKVAKCWASLACSSGINDAAAAVVLKEDGAARARGLKPLARLVAYAHAGVDPKYMGIGPVPATQMALKKRASP